MFDLKLDIPDEGVVSVLTTQNRGFTPEEVSERCADKIMSISITANPIIRAQAEAYKENMRKVVCFYIKEAIKSDRTTVYNALKDAGEPKLAEAIRRM
jgi:hypothetical protein